MRVPTIVSLGLLFGLGCDGAEESATEPGTIGVARAALPAAAAPVCGGPDLPDCPLQQWMKSTLQSYQRAGDFERMAAAFDELHERAPKGYASWSELATGAAAAARKQDAAGVRQACKSCHEQHRARYRRELRAAAWP